MVSEFILIKDDENNDKKCSVEDSANHVFDLRSGEATEWRCTEECMKNEKCVAYSAIWNNWCIGCDTALTETHAGAISFKKSGILQQLALYRQTISKGSCNDKLFDVSISLFLCFL